MIDFVKIGITNLTPAHFLNITLLEFGQVVKINTGEIKSFPFYADYKEFKIIIKSENYIEIQGSLHKYFTGGFNYNDFTFKQVGEAINNLCRDLRLNPICCSLHNLEFGVNIVLPFEPKVFLERLISFKRGGLFSSMNNQTRKNIGYECSKMDQYSIKFYNKNYQSAENTLRVEIKTKVMEFVKPIKTLSDLLRIESFKQLRQQLIKLIESVLVADFSLNGCDLNAKDRELYLEGTNQKYWETLHTQGGRRKYSVTLKRFKQFQSVNGTENYCQIVKELIVSKLSELAQESDVLNNYSKLDLGRFKHSNSILEHPLQGSVIRKIKCRSCGRDISTQKKGSMFCSEKLYGIKAKECRNFNSNPRNNFKNKVKRIERSGVLFDILPYVSLPKTNKLCYPISKN